MDVKNSVSPNFRNHRELKGSPARRRKAHSAELDINEAGSDSGSDDLKNCESEDGYDDEEYDSEGEDTI